MPKPYLSIGIIFKNEIRCLERCLSSLTPLRDAVPCEIVMADTGSDDGSREVAERYADVLFDFPWINDFAAARNAVMDRCTGRWYLSMDADEWLDADVKELADFLRNNNRKAIEGCMLCIRNYMGSGDSLDEYGDFFATRILRMSTGLRYHGAVHEMWTHDDGRGPSVHKLSKTILHHDGYIGLNGEKGAAKRKRNQEILEARLEKDPENVRLLLQYIESSRPDPNHVEYIHRGLAAVESKKPEWEMFGPVIYRYAVLAAEERNLPELEEWIAQAEERFPDSFYTTIDISLRVCLRCWSKEDYTGCIRYGERYLQAVEDCEAGRGDQAALLVSTLAFATPKWKRALRLCLAGAYRKEHQPDRAAELLAEIEPLDSSLVTEMIQDLQELQVSTSQDTSASILRLYELIHDEEDEKRHDELWATFLQNAAAAFSPDVRKEEVAREDFHRYSYSVLLPLAGKCEIGTAAAVMEAKDAQEIDQLLGTVEDWKLFSASALNYALEQGAAFPPSGKSMQLEDMEDIVQRLSQYKNRFVDLVCQTAPQQCTGTWQQLTWARSLVLAGVQCFDWRAEGQGMALAETFAKVEETFLSRCYQKDVLCKENIQVLPPMHRFGWYCGQAFQALKAGGTSGYVRLLREGLETCPQMNAMVDFLTEHTPQLQDPSRELKELAEKVQTLLAAYGLDDPAVIALKQSPVYQKVAHLIEGLEVPVTGGLAQ